jgi:hypothetical protein
MFLKELRFIDQKVEESQFESFFTDGVQVQITVCTPLHESILTYNTSLS